MDAPETVQPDADTSFALMEELQTRGFVVHHTLIHDLTYRGGETCAWARVAEMQRDATPCVRLQGQASCVPLTQYAAVFMRKDPPFDSNYLWATQLLELARGKTLLVNDPRGLREANEKLYATHFRAQMPETLVSSRKDAIKDFVQEQGGKAVLKPLSGAGGDSVFLLTVGDLNMNAIIEAVTRNGACVAMAQAFLPEVVVGDKRILLLEGEPLGAILRVPRKDDVRSNIHVGGSVVKAELDAQDLRIVAAVRDRLRADGLVFVGLDVIGGHLTEVNVTSPTGIQQMSRLSGQNLSARVIDWTLAHVV